MIVIILNEWKILFRNRSIVYVSLIFILSILSLAWMSNLLSENQSKAQAAADSGASVTGTRTRQTRPRNEDQ